MLLCHHNRAADVRNCHFLALANTLYPPTPPAALCPYALPLALLLFGTRTACHKRLLPSPCTITTARYLPPTFFPYCRNLQPATPVSRIVYENRGTVIVARAARAGKTPCISAACEHLPAYSDTVQPLASTAISFSYVACWQDLRDCRRHMTAVASL